MDRMTAAAISHVDITNKLQHGTVHSPARSVSSGTISSSIQLLSVHSAPCQDYELHFHWLGINLISAIPLFVVKLNHCERFLSDKYF